MPLHSIHYIHSTPTLTHGGKHPTLWKKNHRRRCHVSRENNADISDARASSNEHQSRHCTSHTKTKKGRFNASDSMARIAEIRTHVNEAKQRIAQCLDILDKHMRPMGDELYATAKVYVEDDVQIIQGAIHHKSSSHIKNNIKKDREGRCFSSSSSSSNDLKSNNGNTSRREQRRKWTDVNITPSSSSSDEEESDHQHQQTDETDAQTFDINIDH
jgi:hypothetical protein